MREYKPAVIYIVAFIMYIADIGKYFLFAFLEFILFLMMFYALFMVR